MKKIGLFSAIVLVVLLASCPSPTQSSPAASTPEYVGTWVAANKDAFGSGNGTVTMICTATTLQFSLAADGTFGAGTADCTLVIDTSLKHMDFSVTASTGTLTTMFTVGTAVRSIYSIIGTTITIAQGVPATSPYPTDTIGGIALVKQ